MQQKNLKKFLPCEQRSDKISFPFSQLYYSFPLLLGSLIRWSLRLYCLDVQNMKVHENRRQMFSSSASKDASNPFIRQRPLVTRDPSESSVPPAPWASDSASTPLFQRYSCTYLMVLYFHLSAAIQNNLLAAHAMLDVDWA